MDLKRLGAVLAVAYERDLHDFAELLLLENLGPRTLQLLALVAEVVHSWPAVSPIPPGFHSPMAGRMGIRFLYRSRPMMSQFVFCELLWIRPGLATKTNWMGFGV